MRTFSILLVLIFLLTVSYCQVDLQQLPYDNGHQDYLEWSGSQPSLDAFKTFLATLDPLPGIAAYCAPWQGAFAFYQNVPLSNFWYDNNGDCIVYQVIFAKTCQSSSAAVPNQWCQTYCTFNDQGYCTGVAPYMTSVCECHTSQRSVVLQQICLSLSPSVPNSWCGSYCHIDSNNNCSVDAHMSSICTCSGVGTP